MSEKEKEVIEIGIIGAGGMGRFYANTFSKAGWKKYIRKAITYLLMHKFYSMYSLYLFIVLMSAIYQRNTRV